MNSDISFPSHREYRFYQGLFASFIAKVPFYGTSILCMDDENIQQILPNVNRRVVTYGASAQADLRITSSSAGHMASEFHLQLNDHDLGCFRLSVPGAHNTLNATAAIASVVFDADRD